MFPKCGFRYLSQKILTNTSKCHRLKSRRSPVNFSGSGRVFRFRGGLYYDSTKPSNFIYIAGFGNGFRVMAGVLYAYSKASIFKDYSWILSRSCWAGWEYSKAAIFIDYSWILSRICCRILFLRPCPP